MPVVLGQSWNTSLVEAVGRQQGMQARAGGCSQALSPVLQVITDPRFGRLAENFGEDPHIVSAAGFAALAGIQGRSNVGTGRNASAYIEDPVHHPFCQAKHYAGYGASAKDGYTSTLEMSERAVYEVFLVPWRELVSRGLRAVMVSHNMLFGVPMHAHRKLLTSVLRDRFGLGNGYIGSVMHAHSPPCEIRDIKIYM
jgi:beta-glucosidase